MMMSGWIDPSPMLRGSDWLLSLLVASSAKSAVILAAAALSALVLRRGPAAWRHLAWAVAATGSLCLPVVSAVLPGWRVPLATPWPPSPGLGSPPEAPPVPRSMAVVPAGTREEQPGEPGSVPRSTGGPPLLQPVNRHPNSSRTSPPNPSSNHRRSP